MSGSSEKPKEKPTKALFMPTVLHKSETNKNKTVISNRHSYLKYNFKIWLLFKTSDFRQRIKKKDFRFTRYKTNHKSHGL